MMRIRPTIRRPPLHSGQLEVYRSKVRFRVLVAGRRFGKTRLGCVECIRIAVKGGRAWWVAPTYKVGNIGWRLLKRLVRGIPGCVVAEGAKCITFVGGGEIYVRSADDPDSLRGEGLDLVVMDEAAFTAEEAWTHALRPALSDRQGRALFISTPKGRNWFWRLFDAAGDKGDWQAWQLPTSANPYIAAEEIEAARELLPALVFAQEYLAQFTQAFGAMFKVEYFNTFLDSAPDLAYARYWDLAASPEGDWSVGAKLGLDTEAGALVLADVVRVRLPWPSLRRRIAHTAQMDGPDVMLGLEEVAFQLAAVQDMRALPELADVAVLGVHSGASSAAVRALYESYPTDKRSKAARAASWLARAEQGHFWLVRGAWNAEWLAEVCDFPLGDTDDQLDAVSGAVQMIATMGVDISWGGGEL